MKVEDLTLNQLWNLVHALLTGDQRIQEIIADTNAQPNPVARTKESLFETLIDDFISKLERCPGRSHWLATMGKTTKDIPLPKSTTCRGETVQIAAARAFVMFYAGHKIVGAPKAKVGVGQLTTEQLDKLITAKLRPEVAYDLCYASDLNLSARLAHDYKVSLLWPGKFYGESDSRCRAFIEIAGYPVMYTDPDPMVAIARCVVRHLYGDKVLLH